MAGVSGGRTKNTTAVDIADKLGQLTINGDDHETQEEEPTTGPDFMSNHVLYYGWFFDPEVSSFIKGIAEAYLLNCLKVPQFQRFMDNICALHKGKDPESFYRHPRAKKSSQDFQYHVTAKFIGREPHPEYEALSHDFIGRKFKIHIGDMYFMDKSCGIRVDLTPAQSMLFDERDGGNNSLVTQCRTLAGPTTTTPTTSRASLRSKSGHPSNLPYTKEDITRQLEQDLSQLDQTKDHTSCSKKTLQNCKSTLHQEQLIANNCDRVSFEPISHPKNALTPVKPSSSRAHITIGCAPCVKPIQAGLDLLELVDLEQREKLGSVFTQDYAVDGGTLRQFGRKGDAFALYPCHKIVAEAVFNYFI